LIEVAAIPIYLALIGAEWRWRARVGRPLRARDTLASLAMGAGYPVVGVLSYWVTQRVLSITDVWRLESIAPSGLAQWAITFLFIDFSYYCLHRASHRVHWMWASHVVHHTSETLSFAAALRLPWTAWLSGAWLFWLPALWLGVPYSVVAMLLGINLVYQFFLHTEWVGKLGWLEWVLNTPSHHRVHHARNGPYLDRNYGGILIVFDRMFGTFAEERADVPCDYGCIPGLPTANPLRIAVHGWRELVLHCRHAASGWEVLRIALGPPEEQLEVTSAGARGGCNGSTARQQGRI
jgi:sterol desaturase/sphingolipid hydroxylase (fatty acid hydroxylase superfamily)